MKGKILGILVFIGLWDLYGAHPVVEGEPSDLDNPVSPVDFLDRSDPVSPDGSLDMPWRRSFKRGVRSLGGDSPITPHTPEKPGMQVLRSSNDSGIVISPSDDLGGRIANSSSLHSIDESLPGATPVRSSSGSIRSVSRMKSEDLSEDLKTKIEDALDSFEQGRMTAVEFVNIAKGIDRQTKNFSVNRDVVEEYIAFLKVMPREVVDPLPSSFVKGDIKAVRIYLDGLVRPAVKKGIFARIRKTGAVSPIDYIIQNALDELTDPHDSDPEMQLKLKNLLESLQDPKAKLSEGDFKLLEGLWRKSQELFSEIADRSAFLSELQGKEKMAFAQLVGAMIHEIP